MNEGIEALAESFEAKFAPCIEEQSTNKIITAVGVLGVDKVIDEVCSLLVLASERQNETQFRISISR